MTLNEYAIKLGLSLNAAQIRLLDFIKERKDESLISCYPEPSGRLLMYGLIERKKGYDDGYQQCRAEFEPLLKILVDMESDYICEDLSTTEYCEENCKYSCPQKECYLRYLAYLNEQKGEQND